jgi:hypothetical protein
MVFEPLKFPWVPPYFTWADSYLFAKSRFSSSLILNQAQKLKKKLPS